MAPIAFLSLLLTSAPVPPLPDPSSLSAFADEEVPRLLQKHQVAGAVIVFVKDGRVASSRGFGVRDQERALPVDPGKTLFRAGSVSKLFVWTSVMQLAEQGLVDLDTDVNHYFESKGFALPATFEKPITLRHLMGHTPGFEDQLAGLFERDPAQLRTLEQAIRKPPRRVAPPGRLLSYSNYGAALAAYVVEQVSGVPFDRYVEQKIFKPLSMSRSTFLQPLPANLAADMSVGYVARGRRLVPQEFELVSGAYPAGSLSTTAEDLARFLLAHLARGDLEGNAILRAETADRMHTLSSSVAPGFSGMAHGFMHTMTGGGPMLYHGGDTLFFHTFAAILPEQRFGFFISTNTDSGNAMVVEFVTDLLARFFPAVPGRERARGLDNPDPSHRFEGTYLCDRHSESEPARLAMLGMTITVSPAPEGGLLVKSFVRPAPERYVQVGHNLFQQEGGGEQVVFLEDAQGAVRSVVLGVLPVMSFSKPSGLDRPLVTGAAFLFAILMLLVSLVVPPTGLLSRMKRFRAFGEERTAGRMGLLLIAVWLAFFLSVVLAYSGGALALTSTSLGKKTVPFLPYAGLLVSLMAGGLAVNAWRKRLWGPLRRVQYSALVASTFVLFGLLAHWKLIA